MLKIKANHEVLVNVLLENNRSLQSLVEYMESKFTLSDSQVKFMQSKLQISFFKNFNQRWKRANSSKQNFFSLNKDWLSREFEVNFKDHTLKRSFKRPGQPLKAFEDCTKSGKRLKTLQLRKLIPKDQLQMAALQTMDNQVLKIVNAAKSASPKTIKKMSSNLMQALPVPYTIEEALAYFIDCKMTKHQYEITRIQSKSRNADIYPLYSDIIKAKKACYPIGILVTETSAFIGLQELLNHTAQRLIASLSEEDILKCPLNTKLTSKWGCDGASGQREFKQKFINTDEADSSIFMVSMVPLRLSYLNYIVWTNPRPSSTNLCRPISFEFCKETKEKIKCTSANINMQYNNLNDTVIEAYGKSITISHELFETMIDGKVCQALSDTPSSSACVICKACPKEMNNLPLVTKREVDTSILKFGLSTLHARIRFMENILHIAYNIQFKKWIATKENKSIKALTKTRIQNEFKEKMGLLVDFVKQGMKKFKLLLAIFVSNFNY